MFTNPRLCGRSDGIWLIADWDGEPLNCAVIGFRSRRGTYPLVAWNGDLILTYRADDVPLNDPERILREYVAWQSK
jgi:hypothetical protein